MKNRQVWTDRFIGICLFIATLAASRMTDHAGMPQRWHAAIIGILLPFSSIIGIKRTSWLRPTFWTSLSGCFVLNFLLIVSFFEFVLRGVRAFGWIWWVPVAFVEILGMHRFAGTMSLVPYLRPEPITALCDNRAHLKFGNWVPCFQL